MSVPGTTPVRRRLTFDRLDQVMPEVDRLLEGHVTVGQWSLGQICNHLATTLIHSIDGFPRRLPWVVRRVVGPRIFARLDRTGRMPDGIPRPAAELPKVGLDARAEAEALRSAIAFFVAHQGPVAEHPAFGRMDRARWTRVHCLHCAHHLGFAVPTATGPAA